MKRNIYDLSCFNIVSGAIGRLQTIFNMPIVANDTISIDLIGALRLSRLKRFLTLDCKVDLFAFFSPHRHHYSNWIDAIEEKAPGTVETFATNDLTGAGAYTIPPDFLGSVPNSSTLPAHYLSGYWDIHREFFEVPSEATDWSKGSTTIPSVDADRKYGFICARLPSFWTTGINDTRASDSLTYAEVSASGGAGAINLFDLRRVQTEYKDALDHDWFSDRYRDRLQSRWGTVKPPTVDVDERPELLMHSTSWLSGYDVDGTDDAQLGNWRGKSQGMVRMTMPPKYFKEHGMIWVMALLRFPSILQEEKHYLSTNTLTYDNLMGDPNFIRSMKPIALDEDDFTGNGSGTSYGTHPYAQWYRTQPNRVHTDFHGPEGYPFETSEGANGISSHNECVYYSWLDSNDFFMNEDIGQWNLTSKANIEARRVIPPAIESINAGVNLI